MLHTLRQLIGDEAFFASDPPAGLRPPRPAARQFHAALRARTRDFIAIVNQVTGRDLDWFFDVYLHEPHCRGWTSSATATR